jgi:hypothetical protein
MIGNLVRIENSRASFSMKTLQFCVLITLLTMRTYHMDEIWLEPEVQNSWQDSVFALK